MYCSPFVWVTDLTTGAKKVAFSVNRQPDQPFVSVSVHSSQLASIVTTTSEGAGADCYCLSDFGFGLIADWVEEHMDRLVPLTHTLSGTQRQCLTELVQCLRAEFVRAQQPIQ